jgi:hypothetical protein
MRIALLAALVLALSATGTVAAPPDKAGLEFFEQKVRPVLAEHCYGCHSVAAKKHKGGLLLDSRDAIRKGGDTGPAVVPGDTNKSLLLKAVRYDGLHMPPKEKGKLPDRVIVDLERWIKMGAPDPRDKASAAVVALTWPEIIKDRRTWWSLQPVRKPAVPAVKNATWSAEPIDRFLLAELEKHGLQPAGAAERRTLLRRLSLVLTGLPPTPEEVDAFLADPAPNAYEKQVDRLLASPHFGERFAQHWLDVVRYSETLGNEWNYEVPFGYCYRDYVIRAFNDDLPCDRFVREHIAGDLLQPRWNRQLHINESPIGTMFYRFGDGNVEDCVEFPQVGFDVVDNQIDTLGKAFQATTIACARCHDHKLDAVSMKDYYALVGILHSARQLSHTIDAPETNGPLTKKLQELKSHIRRELTALWQDEAAEVARYLLAAQAQQVHAADAATLARGLDLVRLQRWRDVLESKTAADDLFAPWRSASAACGSGFSAAWQKQAEYFAREQRERSAYNREHYRTFADFRNGTFAGWQAGGQGLRGGPSSAGELAFDLDGDTLLKAVLPAGCFTHTVSDRLNGTLRSPVLPSNAGKKISFEVLGRHHSDVRIVSHHCQLADDARWQRLGDDQLYWVTLPLPADPAAFRCYAELMTKFDNPKFPDPIVSGKSKDKENYRVPWDEAAANPHSHFGVTRVVFHDETRPPQPELSHFQVLFEGSLPATPAEAAERYAALIAGAIERWSAGRASDDDIRWIDGLLQRGLLGNSLTQTPRLGELARQYRALERELTRPTTVPGMGDSGPGFEQPLFLRGDCAQPSERVPRRYLEVLTQSSERFAPLGSGRLELAERIACASNPLTARVMVNRLWQHVFGAGLVRSVDDFGHNGERPSHPELLDYLAARFVDDGWSMKRLLRTLVLTRTFQLSNRPGPAARAADPENRWLHHYPARRLEAEAIRDAILAASGRLDRKLYGSSVEPFRERQIDHQRLFSGPVDGNGRRSLYVKHTLMEPPKFLEAFNLPKGVVMQGRRDVTNVPAQALAMLNDSFLLDQADFWAKRLMAGHDQSAGQRIERMFRVALGRPPERDELARFEGTAAKLAALHGVDADKILGSALVWRDLAHTLFNMKEFIYIP